MSNQSANFTVPHKGKKKIILAVTFWPHCFQLRRLKTWAICLAYTHSAMLNYTCQVFPNTEDSSTLKFAARVAYTTLHITLQTLGFDFLSFKVTRPYKAFLYWMLWLQERTRDSSVDLSADTYAWAAKIEWKVWVLKNGNARVARSFYVILWPQKIGLVKLSVI